MLQYTIKRQNLSGHWFLTTTDKHEDAVTLFEYYCKCPFQTVEFWQAGTSWHTVYNKKLDKFFECQEVSLNHV